MIDVVSAVDGTRARRRTWMLGGALFVGAVLFGLWLNGYPGAGIRRMPDLLFAAGTVVFAIGLGRGGSVTARRPLGTTALVALAAWTLLAPLLMLLAATSYDAIVADDYLLMSMLNTSVQVVTLVLAIIAVAQIGRAGVVPRPWRWAPLWALCAIVGVIAVQTAIGLGSVLAEQNELVLLFGIGDLIDAAALGFLGVLAMMLATRPASRSTAVYGPEA